MEGCKTLPAGNASTSLNFARNYLPELILCDLMLPGLGGHGVLSALRANPDTSAIPFLFLTARGSRADFREGMNLGTGDYITKPAGGDEIPAAVCSRLARHAARRRDPQQTLRLTRAAPLFPFPPASCPAQSRRALHMPDLVRELSAIVEPARVLHSREDLLAYGYDGTAALGGVGAAVVMARTTAEVQGVVRFCAENKIPIVGRGSGTGLSGGSVPLPGCVILCLTQMDRVIELDEKNLTILVEAGVITAKVAELADGAGLLYPPDPGSMKISTIGGNVAENSGGLRGLKYGITRDYVMGMEVVLADGSPVWLGSKCVKDVAGYSMKDVFIGSEGTLGIITKVLLKLVPKPQAKKTMLATYSRMDAAAETVSAIIAAKIIPCTLEFLDRITINCVEDYAKIGLPRQAEAMLLMEADGHPASVEDQAAQMVEIARRCGATDVQTARDAEEGTRLASARRTAFSALARVSPTTILEDATVPRSELAKMIRFVQETAARHSLRIGTFGHMGDGNLHPTFLTDEKNAAEMARVEIAMKEIFDFAVSLGGTITGEHGVGIAKKPFLPGAIGAASLGLMKKLKASLDPLGILNPGKIFD